jgi:hypothetical protein
MYLPFCLDTFSITRDNAAMTCDHGDSISGGTLIIRMLNRIYGETPAGRVKAAPGTPL